MTEPLVIIGAAGYGREVLDIVEAMNRVQPVYEFLGFLDDSVRGGDELDRRGARVLGTTSAIGRHDAHYLIAIGDSRVRASVGQELTRRGCTAARAVHPAATMGADFEAGEGLVLAAGARVTTNIRAGRHLHVNLNATIGHDCTMGDYVTLFPGACVSGNVTLQDGVMVGTSAAVLPGLVVGRQAFVGAGGVVVTDLPPGVTAVGVPARPR